MSSPMNWRRMFFVRKVFPVPVLPQIFDPILYVSVSELGDFRYTYGSGPSSVKNFTISGADLLEGVILTAPENYELSLSPACSSSRMLVRDPS